MIQESIRLFPPRVLFRYAHELLILFKTALLLVRIHRSTFFLFVTLAYSIILRFIFLVSCLITFLLLPFLVFLILVVSVVRFIGFSLMFRFLIILFMSFLLSIGFVLFFLKVSVLLILHFRFVPVRMRRVFNFDEFVLQSFLYIFCWITL